MTYKVGIYPYRVQNRTDKNEKNNFDTIPRGNNGIKYCDM